MIDAHALDLGLALQLLRQAGALLPDETPRSAAWLQAIVDALCDLSSKDALSGLVNRRSFEMALAREVDRVARAGEPALLLVLDIDHFKAVNDNHGHQAGDQVIRAVAQAIVQADAGVLVDQLSYAIKVGLDEAELVIDRVVAVGEVGCGHVVVEYL